MNKSLINSYNKKIQQLRALLKKILNCIGDNLSYKNVLQKYQYFNLNYSQNKQFVIFIPNIIVQNLLQFLISPQLFLTQLIKNSTNNMRSIYFTNLIDSYISETQAQIIYLQFQQKILKLNQNKNNNKQKQIFQQNLLSKFKKQNQENTKDKNFYQKQNCSQILVTISNLKAYHIKINNIWRISALHNKKKSFLQKVQISKLKQQILKNIYDYSLIDFSPSFFDKINQTIIIQKEDIIFAIQCIESKLIQSINQYLEINFHDQLNILDFTIQSFKQQKKKRYLLMKPSGYLLQYFKQSVKQHPYLNNSKVKIKNQFNYPFNFKYNKQWILLADKTVKLFSKCSNIKKTNTKSIYYDYEAGQFFQLIGNYFQKIILQ